MSKLSSLRTYMCFSSSGAVSISWCCMIEENGLQDIQPYCEKGVIRGGGRETSTERGRRERKRQKGWDRDRGKGSYIMRYRRTEGNE